MFEIGTIVLAMEEQSTINEECVFSEIPEFAGEPYYVLNTKTHKFHIPTCNTIKTMNEENRQEILPVLEMNLFLKDTILAVNVIRNIILVSD